MNYLPAIILAGIQMLAILSCKSEDSSLQDQDFEPFENSILDVWVQSVSDTGLVNVEGARVVLYETEWQREQHATPAYAGNTDQDGLISFEGLRLPLYWITVSLPEPDGRFQYFFEDEPFKTPGKTVLRNNLYALFDP